MQMAYKTHIYQYVTCLFLLITLTACDMPMRPEGMDTEGMTQIADKLRAQGDDEGAANFYQRALQRSPKDQKARLALADILEAHGDPEGATAQYQVALNLEPKNADYIRGYGRLLLKQGQADKAKEQFEKAISLDSDDVKALNGLGVSLDYLGQHNEAQKIYKRALDEDSDNMTTLSNLGHSYVLAGAYQEAIHLLEPLALKKQATPALRQNLAEAYGLAGMEVDAKRMALLDLNDEQIKNNLNFYKSQRTKLSLAPKLYAECGSFSTEALAKVRVEKITTLLGKAAHGLKIEEQPEVKTIGGTPTFNVEASNFQTPKQLHDFCDHLKKGELTCAEHSSK